MSRFHRTLLASVSGLMASAAFGQTPTPAATPAPATEIKPSVTPYGVIQTKLHLVNSQRQTTPDSELYIARFGFKASYGLAVGQIELGVNPNFCENVYRYAQDTTNKISEKNYCTGNSRVGVRRADAGLNLKLSDTTTLALSFGRIRPGGALGWGVDMTNIPLNYSYVDGARAGVNVDLGSGNSVSAGVTYGNSMLPIHSGDDYNSNALLNDGLANKKDKAVVVGVDASLSNVKAAFYYGFEKNSLTPEARLSKAGGFLVPFDEDANKFGQTLIADQTHIEAHLGYDIGSIAGGVFYHQYSFGDSKLIKSNEAGKLTLGDKVMDARSASNIGLGVFGDSTLFGVADLLQTGDKLTYGASYVMTNDAWDPDNKVKINQMAVGAGYTMGGFALELDFAHTSADKNVFADRKLNAAKSKNEAYLSAVYVF